jgi:hypothetical protein
MRTKRQIAADIRLAQSSLLHYQHMCDPGYAKAEAKKLEAEMARLADRLALFYEQVRKAPEKVIRYENQLKRLAGEMVVLKNLVALRQHARLQTKLDETLGVGKETIV